MAMKNNALPNSQVIYAFKIFVVYRTFKQVMKVNYLKYILVLLVYSSFTISCSKETNDLVNKGPDTSQTENWMQDLIAKYPDDEITLKDICMPRAHDAGIYVLNNCNAGNECNTLTQDQSMANMLKMGIRVFDVRPSLINGEYWTYHRTNCGGFGCEGVELRTFLEETANYLQTHNELVIFQMNNLCNTGAQDPQLSALLNEVLGSNIFTLNTPLDDFLIRTPLEEIIPASSNSGKVILLFEGLSSANEVPASGIFSFNFVPTSGSYANNPDIDIVIADQKQKFLNFNPAANRLFQLSYTFTLDVGMAVSCLSVEDAVSIEDITLEGRSRMSTVFDQWIAEGTIAPNRIPNILSVDFCNTSVTYECIRISEYSLD